MTTLPKQFDVLDATMRLVILHGAEAFLQTEATKHLQGRLEAEHGEDAVRRFTFDGETAELAEVLDELRTYGLFQEHKLVIVDKADRFLRGGAKPAEDEADAARGEAALRREILEETGLEVAVERRVGDYVRSGFAPHTARVYLCRPVRGELRPSSETPLVRWFPLDAVPDTLFPWYRAPLADALAELPEPVTRHEHFDRDLIEDALLIKKQVANCKEILYQMAAGAGELRGEEMRSFTIDEAVEQILSELGPVEQKRIKNDIFRNRQHLHMGFGILCRTIKGLL